MVLKTCSQNLQKRIGMADDNYWRTLLITVPIIGAAMATLFFLMRLCSRLLTGIKLDIGDLLMSFGLFSSYGATISTILGGYNLER